MSAVAEIESIRRALRDNAGWLLALGAGLAVSGLLAMSAPFAAGLAVTLWVGAAILVGGGVQVFYAFRARSFGAGLLTLLLGGVSVLAGLLVLARPIAGLGFLTLLLAAWFLVEGAIKVAHAFQMRLHGGARWLLASGVLAWILGLMIWAQWPLSGSWALGLLVGINLFFTGISLVAMGLAARRLPPAHA